MKNILPFFFIALLVSCSDQENAADPSQEPVEETTRDTLFQVQAAVETEAVSADPEADAADDPAFWYNQTNPEQSLIIGSDKTNGVDVFDLDGKKLNTYLVGRINNVDVRQGWMGTIDIVGGSNRDTVGMDFWQVDTQTRELEYLGNIHSNLEDVYGFCLYHDKETDELYALVNSKTGAVEQWELSLENGKISGELKRNLKLQTQVEGMVADDDLGVLYVGEEGRGVFKFDAKVVGDTVGNYIPMTGEDNLNIKYDVEGVTIYHTSATEGYLIVSSQGNDSFAVFERSGQNKYIASFSVVDGVVDRVTETDGIHAAPYPIGEKYPKGIFICQDDANMEAGTKIAQNFKVVDWREIEQSLK
jgi:3-phytase